ncbi:MAG TPA: sporulation protein [Saprospiraceae bacterium]|nr:sporulation protein [Saprospiraceae bacterium]
MFGEIKKMLGIEDVKLSLKIPEKVKIKEGKITGTVVLTSMTQSEVVEINIKIVEKYYRGRSDSKLIDEYTLGVITLDEAIEIKKNDIVEIPFELPFKIYRSEMDKFEDNNLIFGGIAAIAKKIKGVKSEYRVEAEAFVKGTKLHPHSVMPVKLM